MKIDYNNSETYLQVWCQIRIYTIKRGMLSVDWPKGVLKRGADKNLPTIGLSFRDQFLTSRKS